MRFPAPARTAFVVLTAAAAAWIATAQQQSRRVVDSKMLVNAASNGDEWLTYGHDYAETHYSPLKQITDQNVSKLGLAFSYETEAPAGANVESTPLVHNGVMYGTLGWNVMFAIDARTGAFKWRWDPEIPREKIQGLCCGPVNRGVALYNGKVYQGMLDGRVVALDAETGKLVWQTQDIDPNADMILTSAVRVVKGKVIVGSSGAEHGVRGYFSAYDAETGKRAWRFYTVPGDPAKGFEHPELAMAAKTWTGEWYKMGGGGTVWDAMAYDSDADILYVGTGNGSPWNAAIRSPQGGDNLFLSSIIAVKPDTGRMVWYFQTTPGDTWDYTAVQPVILADLTINGRARKVIMQAPKNGFFYVLDRLTGEFISGSKYAKRVTWATGLDAKGRPIEAKGARFTTESITVSPGPGGAHNWHPMSYSPLTKLVYIPGAEGSGTYSPDLNFQYRPGFWNTGTNVGRRPQDQPFVAPPKPEGGIPQPAGAVDQPQANGGFLVAMDPATNTERWRVTGAGVGGFGGGGTMATAGNLVFHGAGAYNATTGEKLWEQPQMGGGTASWITYMLDGKQYVALLARAAPNNRVFAFTLEGSAAMPPPPAPAAGKGGKGGGKGTGGPPPQGKQ